MTGNQSVFSAIEISMGREAAMSSMALGIGLTHIRKYNFAQKGYFYSGLQSYCVGIERLAKLILIYDFRLNNNDNFPHNTYVRNYSHKISDLFNKVRSINQINGRVDSSFLEDEFYNQIIALLADFAWQARYYNLDYITGATQKSEEPLKRWDSEICSIIVARHHKQNVNKLSQNRLLNTSFGNSWTVRYNHEDGTDIDTFSELLTNTDLMPTKQKYSMYYLYVLARFLCNILIELEYKGNFFPCLREYFAKFTNTKRSVILRRQIWDPKV